MRITSFPTGARDLRFADSASTKGQKHVHAVVASESQDRTDTGNDLEEHTSPLLRTFTVVGLSYSKKLCDATSVSFHAPDLPLALPLSLPQAAPPPPQKTKCDWSDQCRVSQPFRRSLMDHAQTSSGTCRSTLGSCAVASAVFRIVRIVGTCLMEGQATFSNRIQSISTKMILADVY